MPGSLTVAAVSFDVYGTLIDIATDEDRPAVWDALARGLRGRGVPVDAERLYRGYRREVRRRLRNRDERYPEIDVVRIFATVLPRLAPPEKARLAHALAGDVAREFRRRSTLRLAAFSDAVATLQALRGRVPLAAVSDAQRLFLEPELRAVGLACFFDVVVISSDHGFRKPDPRLFRLALDRLRVPAAATVHVGDNPDRDVAGAKAAGLIAVHLHRAAPPPSDDHTVATLLDLLRWVEPRTR
ncbi:MAG: HAD family hydrolase [Mycobacterium leprae]